MFSVVLKKRIDVSNKLINWEFRNYGIRGIFQYLPSFIRPKPLFKAGIRSCPASTISMDTLLGNLYNDDRENILVGVLVYMWVQPYLRNNRLGDFLLQLVTEESLLLGYEYLLLVHDDQGSGKLVEFYQRRGFFKIFNFVNKGMIAKLTDIKEMFNQMLSTV